MSNNEYVALSKIMMTPKGVWNSQARYEILDVVTYTENSNGIGNIYVAIKNNIGVGVRPTDTSYWQCILNTSNVSISMVNVVDRINQMINDLDNKRINTVKLIDSLINAYGTPLVANTTTDMQDQSKIYVYTGSDIGNYKKGYWYFYNGEAWTEGDQFSSLPDSTVQQLANLSKAMPTKKHYGNIIVAKDTIKAPLPEFVLYGKSVQAGTPTPDDSADIATTGSAGNIVVRSTNGNLFNPAYLLGASGWTEQNGIYSGDALALFNRFQAAAWVPDTPAGTPLTISGRAIVPTSIQSPRFVFQYNDGSVQNVNITTGSSFAAFSGTCDTSKIISRITFTYSSGEGTVSLTDLRISIGAEPVMLDYVTPTTITIPTRNELSGIPVPDGGNYTDENGQQWICNTIDKASGTYTQRVGKVVWTGDSSEQWMFHAWSLPGFVISVPDSAIQTNVNAAPNVLCDRLQPIPNSAVYSQYDALVSMTNNAPIYQVAIRDYDAEADFRAYLGTHNITMIYPLAMPVVTPLTAEQIDALNQLWSNDNDTIIYINDNVQPEIQTELCYKLTPYLEKQIQECIGIYKAAEGKSIYNINNTLKNELAEFKIYGKSVQNGIPTIDDPIPIATVGSTGGVGVMSAGKNFAPYPYSQSSVTADGVTFTARSDGSVRVQGTATGNAATYVMKGNAAVKAALVVGQQYKVTSYDGGNDHGPYNDCWFQVYSGDGGVDGQGYDTFTWRGSNDCNMGIRVRNGATVDTVVYPMIRLASIDDARYAPYVGVNTTLPTPNGLPGIPVPSDGNYTDSNGQQWICDTIDKAAGIYTKRCAILTLDGSAPSDWRKDSTTNSSTYRFAYPQLVNVVKRSDNNKLAALLCTHYPVVTANSTWNLGCRQNGIAVANNGGLYITDIDLNTTISTVDDLMFKFASAPMTIVYALETPLVLPLTSIQMAALENLETLKGSTTIYTTDELMPEFSLKALINTTTTTDNDNNYLGSDGQWHIPDVAPIANSTNLITSGAVYNATNDALRFSAQNLTNEQAYQARINLQTVSYSSNQNLSDASKTQARTNIGALGQADLNDVIKYTPQTTATAEQKAQARSNIGALGAEDITDVIRYSSQTLGNALKEQARENIGALSYDAQSLTSAQKAQARMNIGAPSTSDVSNVLKYIPQTITSDDQARARANIGAAATTEVKNVLKYSEQTLKPVEKLQARTNIGLEEALCYSSQFLSASSQQQARENINVPSKDEVLSLNDLSNIQMYQTFDKSSLIVANNTTTGALKQLMIYGKTKQNKTTGKNLIKPGYGTPNTSERYGITFNRNEDGSIHIFGIATQKAFYTLSFTTDDQWELAMPCLFSEGTTFIASLQGANADIYMGVGYYKGDGTSVILASQVRQDTTITLGDDPWCWRIYIAVESGATVDNIVYPMIRFSSIMDGTYEPYSGGMPTPQFNDRQPIITPATELALITSNKNIIDKDYGELPNRNNVTGGKNGITYTYNNGTYKLKGTSNKDHTIDLTSDPDIKNGEFYCDAYCGKSMIATCETNNEEIYLYVEGNDGQILADHVNNNSVSFIIPEDCSSLRIYLFIPSGAVLDTICKPMIRLACIEDASYVPPMYTPTNIDVFNDLELLGIPVSTGGNYTDKNNQQWICDVLDNDAQLYTQRIGKIILDGTQTYHYIDNTRTYYIELNDLIHVQDYTEYIMSDAMITVADQNNIELSNPIGSINTISGYKDNINIDTNRLYFTIGGPTNNIGYITSLLSNNPVTVLYVLANPIVKNINSLTSCHSYNNTTAIYTRPWNNQNSAIDPDISVAVPINTETFVTERFNTIEARLAALEANT